MTLIGLILLPMIGGLAAWHLARINVSAARWLCIGVLGANLLWSLLIWLGFGLAGMPVELRYHAAWIPQIGAAFDLWMDGLSLLLIILTNLMGILAVASSWTAVHSRVGFFHFNLMILLGALVAVFLAYDLLLFYFAWEVMLVPLYFLIGIWGYERRIYATIKFFIFTQAGSLLMLLAIMVLYFQHGRQGGVYTFDAGALAGTGLSREMAMLLMLGFFAAFAVKLPAFPFHTWLPDAHTEAPTAGSVILAAVVLKAGAFGMLRFMVPLFPEAVAQFAPAAMTLAVVGIIYGAVLAFAQTDLKRLVAYTSVSHMGFVLLGVFSGSELALQGAVIVILAHGLSTGGLFILVGGLYERIHTRDMSRMGGMWAGVPRMGGVGALLSLASLGLPGLANFVGEFLVLLGVFKVSPLMAALASLGLVASAIYSLWMFQKVFHGPKLEDWTMPDLAARECLVSVALIVPIVLLGVYPQPVLRTSAPAMQRVAGSSIGVPPMSSTGILPVSPVGVPPAPSAVSAARAGEGKMPSRRAGETPATPSGGRP